MTSQRETTTDAGIAAWLIDRIRFYGQVDDEEVTLDAPLAELGLDSIYVMTLCGDIEDTYGVPASPVDFEQLETLGDLAADLSSRIGHS